MNNRERFEELLERWLVDELVGDERAEWESLLEQEPAWAEEASEERQLVDLLRTARTIKAPANLLDSARTAARKADVLEIPMRKGANRWAIGSAAAIFLAGVLVWGLYKTPDQTPRLTGELQNSTVGDAKKSEPSVKDKPSDQGQEAIVEAFTTVPDEQIKDTKPVELGLAQPASPALDDRNLEPATASVEAVAGTIARQSAQPVEKAKPGAGASLPTLTEAKSQISRQGGRILADTRWLSTAEALVRKDNDLTETESEYGARYIVAELPARNVSRKRADDSLFASASTVETDRSILAYRDESPTSETTAVFFQAKMENLDSTYQVGDFDEFLELVSKQGGQFLFYTSDRETALKPYWKQDAIPQALRSGEPSASPTPDNSPTPLPKRPQGFDGFLVLFFADQTEAQTFLEILPRLQGPGMEDLEPSLAEYIAQPQGGRVVVPYRMMNDE